MATEWRLAQCAFEKCLLRGRERPRVPLCHNRLVGRIEAAPHQSEIAFVVIEKTLIPEACVKRIGLFELVLMPA